MEMDEDGGPRLTRRHGDEGKKVMEALVMVMGMVMGMGMGMGMVTATKAAPSS